MLTHLPYIIFRQQTCHVSFPELPHILYTHPFSDFPGCSNHTPTAYTWQHRSKVTHMIRMLYDKLMMRVLITRWLSKMFIMNEVELRYYRLCKYCCWMDLRWNLGIFPVVIFLEWERKHIFVYVTWCFRNKLFCYCIYNVILLCISTIRFCFMHVW